MAANTEILISVGVLAQRLGVSRQTVRDWEEIGRLPRGLRLDNGRRDGTRVWRESDLRDALSRTRETEKATASAA
jgi:DNA-binding transcriptional MerR regulator